MTITCGFFNSVSNDRLYNAVQISQIFDGVIEDGIFAAIGDHFLVIENTGMQVAVGSGRAWFNHTWTYNDADVLVTVPTADVLLPRIDVVYLEVNEDVATRFNKVDILAGTPASNPVAPTLTNTATVHQYPLAHIAVAAGATSIAQANITNKIGLSATPFVTGPLSVIATDDLLIQWQDEFNTWFDAIKGQLTTEAEGNLQSQIYAIVGDVNPPLIDLVTLSDHDHTSGNGDPIPSDGLATGAVTAGKIAAGGVSATDQLANDIVDDTKVGDRVPQFYRRQGAFNDQDWESAGTTNYTPGKVRMQAGAITKTIGANITIGSVAVTFPVAFSHKPLVLITLAGDDYSTTPNYLLAVYNPLTTGFTIQILVHTTRSQAVTIWFNWLAIGPE